MDGRDVLIRRLGLLVRRGMTPAGHLAQLVPQEHRGNCTHAACTPACIEARDLLSIVEPYLESRADAPTPARAGRRGILPMSRRPRAVPRRSLPPAPARGSASAGQPSRKVI